MNDTSVAGDVPETEPDDKLPRPGAYIAAQREAAGLTQAQVGETLHLTLHYIRALENDEYRKLPGLTFVKGYFRAYARLLRIDESEVLGYYDRYVATLDIPGAAQPQTLHVQSRSDQSVSWALVAGVLLVLGLGAGWWFFGRDLQPAATASISLPQQSQPAAPGQSAPPGQSFQAPQPATLTPPVQQPAIPAAVVEEAAAADPAAVVENTPAGGLDAQDSAARDNAGPDSSQDTDVPAGAAATEAEPAAVQDSAALDTAAAVVAPDNSRHIELAGNGDDRLQLQFSGNSWVEIEDASMARLYGGMMGPGDTLSIRATAPFNVLLGDARGVELALNENPFGVAAQIREDNSARVRVTAEGLSPWVIQ